MIVKRLMKLPNDQAYARTFQKPAATQNQMSARTTAQKAEPHCASVKLTVLPTKLKLATPRKTSIRQTSNRPASPAANARIVTPIGRCIVCLPPSTSHRDWRSTACSILESRRVHRTVRSRQHEPFDPR